MRERGLRGNRRLRALAKYRRRWQRSSCPLQAFRSRRNSGAVQAVLGAVLSRRARIALVLPLALTIASAACGDDSAVTPPPDGGPGPDAGDLDGGPDAPPDGDAGVPSPWPAMPHAGQFAWGTVIAGVGDQVVMGVAPDGDIFIAGDHRGAIDAGQVHLAAPQRAAIVVLRLSAAGTPIWARSFDGADRVTVRTLAVAADGDVVVGGAFAGTALDLGLGPVASAGHEDGFMIRLSGATGAIGWVRQFGSPFDDTVASVVTAADGALYVYGQLGSAAEVSGDAFAAGAFLARYEGSGVRAWARSFAQVRAGWQGPLALDAQRGPVIAGAFTGTLALGDHVLAQDASDNDSDGFVAGFTPDGEVRFATQVVDSWSAYSRSLAVAASGDVYLANGIDGPIDVDGHTTWSRDLSDLYLLRLTAEGRYAWSTVIHGAGDNRVRGLATDAAGAVYLIGSCSGQVDVQPTIACANGGGVVVSYGPDNTYRWSTYVAPGWLQAVAPAPDGRVLVAGEATSGPVDFGGVVVPAQGLFIGAIATGPAVIPSPLPPVPAIAAVVVEGAPDRQVRHGSIATLLIEGTALDRVTSARLGDIDVHVPAATATTSLRLVVTIPHGHVPGMLPLVLSNAAGSAELAGAVEVTPVVVTPSGSDSGRGTFSSPFRLCRASWFDVVDRGDVLALRDGVHQCNDSVAVRRGVIIRGQSTTGTIVRGQGSQPFRGFWVGYGSYGTSAIESLTIETGDSAAVRAVEGHLAVRAVDVRGAGVTIDTSGTATLTRYRYLAGTGVGLLVHRGNVVADGVEITTTGTGVVVIDGTVRIADSVIAAGGEAVDIGSLNHDHEPLRQVAIERTVLRAGSQGVVGHGAVLDLRDVEIMATSAAGTVAGVSLSVGHAQLTGTTIAGFELGVRLDSWSAKDFGRDVSATIEDATIDATYLAIDFAPGSSQSHLRLRRTRATGGTTGLRLYGELESVDLGTAASPGDNHLVSTSDGFALEDTRTTLGPDIHAHGTTFNGETFTGSATGATEVPGRYRIAGPNTISF